MIMLSPVSRPGLRYLLTVLSAMTVFPLLGYLYRLGSMQALFLWISVPCLMAVLAAGAWRAAAGDVDLARRIELGFWGGMLGTVGYDVVRVPLHLMGFNPFAPIRSYGVLLCGAPASTVFTDLAGIGWHFCNGVFFGVMFALVVRARREMSVLLGLAWGLGLETLAVLTAFGSAYGIRSQPGPLFFAYAAHLFYGWPLGRVAAMEAFSRTAKAVTLALSVLTVAVLVVLYLPGAAPRDFPAEEIVLAERAVAPAWTCVEAGGTVRIVSRLSGPVNITVGTGAQGRTILMPGQIVDLPVPTSPGIVQIRVERDGVRSGFLLVGREGFITGP